jgi:DNA-binding NarL/FixJ family response regulator
MSVMDGIEAIRPIKDLAPSTKVFILTNFFDDRHKKSALAAGASGFLLKRNSPTHIVAAIRALPAHLNSHCQTHVVAPQ